MHIDDALIYPSPEFADEFQRRIGMGVLALSQAKLVFVGLARNCGVRLAENLGRLEQMTGKCREWALHIESNDCTDQTLEVLQSFACKHPQATYHYQTLGRRQFSAEFSGPRTIALAEYRDACQRWVRGCHRDADYVVVVDWDQWGGWSEAGFLNGLGWLADRPSAFGMASVSLAQSPTLVMKSPSEAVVAPQWIHYDAWALRGVGQADTYWDDYTRGQGGWKHQWMPPIGSAPVLVSSAFGGLCIYRTGAYLAGTYDGTTDCEHVPYHASIARKTGQRLYVNPSQRCVMSWMEPHEGQHGDD